MTTRADNSVNESYFEAFMKLPQSTKNSMSLLYRIHGFSCLATTRLTTDTEVKKLDFYAISASKARVLILIGWESGEKILNQSQIRKVQNQIFSTKTAPKSWYLLNSLLQSKSLLQKKAETSTGFSETCWHTNNKTAKCSWLFFQIWAIDYICLARWCYTCNTTRFITQ